MGERGTALERSPGAKLLRLGAAGGGAQAPGEGTGGAAAADHFGEAPKENEMTVLCLVSLFQGWFDIESRLIVTLTQVLK